MENLVIIKYKNKLVVDSRQVAGMVEKRHADLMRDIENYNQILENAKLRSHDFFIPSTYKTEGNTKTYPCYLITKKGCDMVANKMTGEKGVLFTANYIEKFYEMERQLNNTPSLPDFTNPVIAARAWADAVECKQLAEAEVERLAPKAAITEAFIERKHAVGFRELAKELSVKESILRNFLIETNIAYRQKDKWKPYAPMIEKGYMIVKDVQNSQNGYTTTQALWTMEGKEFVRRKLQKVGIIAA